MARDERQTLARPAKSEKCEFLMPDMPTWSEFVVPVLRELSGGQVLRLRELYEAVGRAARITDEQRAELLSSGQPKVENRIGWAASYLNRVGAVERPARGQYVITESGKKLLADNPGGISEAVLRSMVKEGDEWWLSKAPAPSSPDTTELAAETVLDPEEQVEEGIGRIHATVAAELLDRLHGKEPAFFERAVVDLLVAMGYGGADGQARVTSQSNDAGIDGIIDQDTLGLSRVYVQAKRYAPNASVQRPELQAFVGALSGKADGGVFITTGRFSKGAREYAASVPTRIILIDGERLTSLMIRYGVGVQAKRTMQIVQIDEDFFE